MIRFAPPPGATEKADEFAPLLPEAWEPECYSNKERHASHPGRVTRKNPDQLGCLLWGQKLP